MNGEVRELRREAEELKGIVEKYRFILRQMGGDHRRSRSAGSDHQAQPRRGGISNSWYPVQSLLALLNS
jgi:hypothetical protein